MSTFSDLIDQVKLSIFSWVESLMSSTIQPSTPLSTLKQLIASRNLAYKRMIGENIDAEIHKLTPDQVSTVATLMIQASEKYHVDLAFLAACSFQESQWDPACYNHNLAEHSTITFAGTDWGFGQNSGTQLLSLYKGKSEAELQVLATNPRWSIDYFGEVMNANYFWATTLLEAKESNPGALIYWSGTELAQKISKLPTTVAQPFVSKNKEIMTMWLSTTAYNSGRKGIQDIIQAGGMKNGNLYTHGHQVMTWLTEFAPLLSEDLVNLLQ